MNGLIAYLPFLELRKYDISNLPRDLIAALAVAFLAIPQGVAYAMIAGIPPAMGLYAATLPTMFGSLFRSSRHVVTGPTNAVSLLVGTAVATQQDLGDPAAVAVTLALMVGVCQLVAGALRLGTLVYYISSPVVIGYITGAGALIGVGQLKNVTNTPAERGHGVVEPFLSWVEGLSAGVDGRSVFIALATAAAIIVVKRLSHKLPAAAVVIGGATLLSAWLGLDTQGLRVVRDIAPIEGGLPSLSYPDLTLVVKLIPVAVAVTLLSLVESTSVARSIAGRTGQRLNLSTEFTGEGVANLLAAFFGGYPTTGSLSRSALNEREGATSRLAGFFSGLFVLIAVFGFGSTLNYTPTASLAGLLLVVAVGLVDRPHIARIFRSTKSDRIAFLTTLAGTFFLHLDQAIYVGVGISLVLFLRQARMLAIRDLVIDSGGRLREAAPSGRPSSDPDALPDSGSTYCDQVQCINVEGSVFFGAAGELQTALDDVAQNLNIQVLVIRLKRARNMDVTTVDVLLDFARQWRSGGRHVLLVGMLPGFDAYLRKTGAVDELGSDNVFPQQTDHWFSALEDALTRAYELVGEDHTCDPCNLEEWLHHRGVT